MAIQATEQQSDDRMEIDNQTASPPTTNVQEESIPSISQQRTIIKEHLDKKMEEGQVWCLLERRWLDSWKHYVNYEKGGVAAAVDNQEEEAVNDAPAPIDNSSLLDASRVEHETSDPFLRLVAPYAMYELITQEGFHLLQKWYGGGPEIARKVIMDGHAYVEISPYILLLATNKGIDAASDPIVFTEVSFSKKDTLERVVTRAKELFNIEKKTQTRLWRALASSPYSRVSVAEMEEDIAQSISKQYGQQLLLEVQVNNEWQIESGDSDDSDGELLSLTAGTAKVSNSTSSVASSASTAGGALSSQRATSSYSSWSNDGDNRRSDPGVCGLQNLGNTCFMNSALQCLAKTPDLIPYFCKEEYIKEINPDNPLGMGGKIATAFGNLMKEMWSGRHSYVSPKEFKYTIGKFAPQFSGYQQQDSQELIAYLLDGLHEDLNRILKKPTTEQIEYNGRPDDIVADESWVNHKKRNDSIIVDKFQGQLKSTLVCPKCDNVSITFDPYMYLSLPLPVENNRAINVTVFENGKVPTMYQVKVPKRGMISEVRAGIAQICGIEEPHRIAIVEIFSNRVYKYLSDRSEIKSILDNDILHAHVISPGAEVPEDIHSKYSQYDSANLPFLGVRVMTTQKEESRYYSGVSYRNVVVGSPFITLFNRESTTNKQLYDDCFNFLKPYIRFDIAQQHNIDLTCENRSSFFPDTSFGKKKQEEEEKKRKESNRYTSQYRSYDDDDDSDEEYGRSGYPTTSKTQWDDDSDDMRDEQVANSADEDKGEGADQQQETAATAEENNAEQVDKFHFFYLKFEDSSSYMTTHFDEENEKGVLPYTDDVVQFPRERYSMGSDKKSIMLYINPEVLENLIDYKEFSHVEHHESTKYRNKASGVSLDSCLELFTKQEQLGEEDTWYCPKCKEFVQATKKFDIWSVPEVLVIHLKRFQYNKYSRDKLDTYVDYPLDDFDLTPHILTSKDGNNKYTLFAVSNHYGGLGGGHYTAYAKITSTGQWYKFDDSSVHRCNPDDSKTSAGYVLFYHRKPNTDAAVDSNAMQSEE